MGFDDGLSARSVGFFGVGPEETIMVFILRREFFGLGFCLRWACTTQLSSRYRFCGGDCSRGRHFGGGIKSQWLGLK